VLKAEKAKRKIQTARTRHRTLPGALTKFESLGLVGLLPGGNGREAIPLDDAAAPRAAAPAQRNNEHAQNVGGLRARARRTRALLTSGKQPRFFVAIDAGQLLHPRV
jgi:hypothetical protein